MEQMKTLPERRILASIACMRPQNSTDEPTRLMAVKAPTLPRAAKWMFEARLALKEEQNQHAPVHARKRYIVTKSTTVFVSHKIRF